MRDRHNWLLLLLGLVLVRGLAYAAVVPPWQSPDETGHFEYAWLIAHLGRLPTLEDTSPGFERELMGSLYEWRYGEYLSSPLPEQMSPRMNGLPPSIFASRSRTVLMQRFSLAYLWQALFVWPFRYQDLLFKLYVARLSSVLLNVAIVWLAWRIFAAVLPHSREWAIAMTAFVIFLPQHTFINASVNEGPLAELCACGVLYGWLCLFRQRIRVGSALAIVGGTLLGIWAKNTAVFLLPFDVLMVVAFLVRHYRGASYRRRLAYYLALSLALLLLLGYVAFQTPAGRWMRAIVAQWWSAPQVYVDDGRISLDRTLWGTYDSFWAGFGWMSVRAGPAWYLIVYVLTVLAIEGWVFPRCRGCVVPAYVKMVLGGALLLSALFWLTFVLVAPGGLGYYQGRYLFPVTVPVAFFLVEGWARWTPERWQWRFAFGVVVSLALLDAAAVFLALMPFSYTW